MILMNLARRKTNEKMADGTNLTELVVSRLSAISLSDVSSDDEAKIPHRRQEDNIGLTSI